jgi:glycine/D-amino acid oxidase-like deaminating enzyme
MAVGIAGLGVVWHLSIAQVKILVFDAGECPGIGAGRAKKSQGQYGNNGKTLAELHLLLLQPGYGPIP